MSTIKLMPGTQFHSINLETIDGETINLGSIIDGKRKLIVIYRGQFCPFCQGMSYKIEFFLALLTLPCYFTYTKIGSFFEGSQQQPEETHRCRH